MIKNFWDPSKTEISKTEKIITNTNGIIHQKTNLKYTRDPPKTEADVCNNSTTRKKHMIYVRSLTISYMYLLCNISTVSTIFVVMVIELFVYM